MNPQLILKKYASTKRLSYYSIAKKIASRIPEAIVLKARRDDIQLIASELSLLGLRYLLAKQWDSRPPLIVIMLNPSTATAEKDDRTIARITSRAKALHCGGFIVMNIGAARATQPKVWISLDDPIGPHNIFVIRNVCKQVIKRWGEKPTILLAWGDNVKLLKTNQVRKVLTTVQNYGKCYHLGLTQSGNPRHPLYISSDTQLIRYRG